MVQGIRASLGECSGVSLLSHPSGGHRAVCRGYGDANRGVPHDRKQNWKYSPEAPFGKRNHRVEFHREWYFKSTS